MQVKKPTYEQLQQQILDLQEQLDQSMAAARVSLEAHKQSQEKYRALIDTTDTGYVILDVSGCVIDANTEYARLTGHSTVREILGRNVVEWTAAYDREKNRAEVIKCLETGSVRNLEIDYLHAGGAVIPIEINATVVGPSHGPIILTICRDISARRQSERAILRHQEVLEQTVIERTRSLRKTFRELEESKTQLQSIIDNTSAVIYLKDLDGSYLLVNNIFETLFHVNSEDMRGKTDHDLFPEHLADAFRANDLKVIESGQPLEIEEFAPHDDGLHAYISLKFPLHDKFGKFYGVCGISTDITEHKRAVDALRRSEEKYRGIFDESIVTIYLFDEHKNFLDSNQAGLDLLGYSRKELLSMSIPDVDADPMVVLPAHQELLTGGRLVNYEHRLRRKDGAIITVLNNSRPITDGCGNVVGMQSTLIDITERKRINEEKAELEQQLLQAQKMEAIGQLAGGIAHDFNNIIATISGTAELLLKTAPADSPNHTKITRIMKSSSRAKDLAMKLLTFARKEKLNTSITSLNALVLDVVDILKGGISKKITIKMVLAPDLLNISADTGQITQVLMNVSLNACDAMSGGGTLGIQTRNVVLTDEKILVENNAAPGDYCMVCISDTGHGIAQEHKHRIFEPFFTTKERGRGSGLGLSVSHGIITEHNGFFELVSEPGQGAAFCIYLPATTLDADVPEPALRNAAPAGAQGTLLIIDDDEDFIQMAGEAFREDGFEVLLSLSGKAGIEIFKKQRHTIDLVMLDMMLPEMDGNEIFYALRAVDPRVRIILCSGYSIQGKATELLANGALAFIQKPFSIYEVSEEISRILKQE